MKHPFFIILIALISVQLHAQSPYEILTLNDGVFAVKTNMSTGHIHYFVTDESLLKIFEDSINLNPSIRKVLHHTKDEMVYILFNWGSFNDYEKILLSINTRTGESQTLQVQSITSNIDFFRILGDKIALVTNSEGNQAHVQFATLETDNQDLATFHLHTNVLDISETEGYLDVLTASHPNRGTNKLQIMSFSEQGERLYTIDAEFPSRRSLFIKTAHIVKNEDGEYRIVGTYSKSARKNSIGYFQWKINSSLTQDLSTIPYSRFESLAKEKNKKIKRQIKHELSKGFQIVKITEMNDMLTIVAVPAIEDYYIRKYPKVFNSNMYHIVNLDNQGEVLEDKVFAFTRSLKSPYITRDFLHNPPLYTIDGSLYFLHNEEFSEASNLIIHNISSDLSLKATERLPSNLQEGVIFYQTKQWKDKDILVYGIQGGETDPKSNRKFFLEKIQID
jgi:hypothetical protein